MPHAAGALNQLAEKIQARKPIPPKEAPLQSKVVIGEEYVNSPTLSDVTFMVEVGREADPEPLLRMHTMRQNAL